ncbi:MAG: hypothetical protein JJT93_11060 [Gammaproteobacteria bacterium]|nr:hypothetical protein [Gammaproteobacteria bacterium]
MIRSLAMAVLLAALIGWSTACTAEPSATPDKALLEQPWQEALLSVRDLDDAARFFIEVGGFETVDRGPVDRSELNYWGLDEDVRAEHLLLRAPGSQQGWLRFIRFEGVAQRPIRVGARAWDTGGYFSLMLRAKDLDAVYDDALRLGWTSESEPVRFDFPPSQLANVVLKGPDGINIALYERLSPPLDEFWTFDRLSQPFNAMQMVADMTPAEAFFTELLGMSHFWTGDFLDPEPGPNNFGLPQNLTTEIPRRTRILSAVPGETGRLELMQFVGLDGRNLADRAAPPNLGILSIRYEVSDADAAHAHFTAAGGQAWQPLATITLPPYGEIRIFAVRAPDGAIVELWSRHR